MAEKPVKRRSLDWDAVERDYRTAKFTLRELAEKYGVSHQAIDKRAKKYGWTQDLALAIKQATNAKLVQELVDKEVATGGQEVANTVLAAAELNKQVILKHRKDIEDTRFVAAELLEEVRGAKLLDEERELLAEILAGEGAEPKDVFQAQKVVRKALGFGSRVASVKALAETFVKLQDSERKAFGLGNGEVPPDEPPDLTLNVKIEPGEAYKKMLGLSGK